LPVIEALADEFEGRIQFVCIDVDQEGAIQTDFDSSKLPAYLLYEDGQEIDRILIPAGWLLEPRVRRMLNQAL